LSERSLGWGAYSHRESGARGEEGKRKGIDTKPVGMKVSKKEERLAYDTRKREDRDCG